MAGGVAIAGLGIDALFWLMPLPLPPAVVVVTLIAPGGGLLSLDACCICMRWWAVSLP